LGVFDSGLGGLTVVRALLEALPNERIVYLGDTARVPYGTRSAQTVMRYALGCSRVLVDHGIKGLVVACNTVSAVALDLLRAEFDLPVVGVVEPGALAAVRAQEAVVAARGRTSEPPPKIGVLGTPGTIASGAYPRAVARLTTRVEVVGQAAPLLVPLAEEGWLEGPVPELIAEQYLAPLIEARAGAILLGCTHYPLLRPTLTAIAARLAGREVLFTDSAQATAEAVKDLFEEGRLQAAEPRARGVENLTLLVTDLPTSFSAASRRFLGHEAPDAHQIDLRAD
jgi:glutamate racemase